VGVPGELYIGGDGLARGYLERPALTAEKFVASPFAASIATMDSGPLTIENHRLYRTGDLARYRPDGQIIFMGRMDHQVKIRGFRIELDEIDLALQQQPQIQDVVTLAKELHAGDWGIVSYLVLKPGQTITVGELRHTLKQTLPHYMIPAHLVFLDAFPLTPNGKLNRQALPQPEAIHRETEFVQPRTEIERTVAVIWQEVLRVEKVGMNDNFFDLGGHSLLMVQVHIRLIEAFPQEIALVDLFRHPTVHELARHLSQQENTSFVPRTNEEQAENRKSSMQQRREKRQQHRNVR
jgi:acyl carrier protein